MKNFFLATVMLLSAAAFASCGGNDKPAQESVKASVQDLNSDAFRQKMNENPGILVDVRTPEEIAEGKIPGALEMNIMDSDFADKIANIEKGKPIYVYCKAGGRSSNAAQKLINLGYSEVYNLDGGMDSWKQKGYEKE